MCGRVISGRTGSITTADVFNAVTTNAAKALQRDDIGPRLAPGAKADLVLVDLKHPTMQPVRDPLTQPDICCRRACGARCLRRRC